MMIRTNAGGVELTAEMVCRGMVFEDRDGPFTVTGSVGGTWLGTLASRPESRFLGCNPEIASRADCERFGVHGDAAAHGFARLRDGGAADIRRWSPKGSIFRREEGERIELGFGGPTFGDERFIGLHAGHARSEDVERLCCTARRDWWESGTLRHALCTLAIGDHDEHEDIATRVKWEAESIGLQNAIALIRARLDDASRGNFDGSPGTLRRILAACDLRGEVHRSAPGAYRVTLERADSVLCQTLFHWLADNSPTDAVFEVVSSLAGLDSGCNPKMCGHPAAATSEKLPAFKERAADPGTAENIQARLAREITAAVCGDVGTYAASRVHSEEAQKRNPPLFGYDPLPARHRKGCDHLRPGDAVFLVRAPDKNADDNPLDFAVCGACAEMLKDAAVAHKNGQLVWHQCPTCSKPTPKGSRDLWCSDDCRAVEQAERNTRASFGGRMFKQTVKRSEGQGAQAPGVWVPSSTISADEMKEISRGLPSAAPRCAGCGGEATLTEGHPLTIALQTENCSQDTALVCQPCADAVHANPSGWRLRDGRIVAAPSFGGVSENGYRFGLGEGGIRWTGRYDDRPMLGFLDTDTDTRIRMYPDEFRCSCGATSPEHAEGCKASFWMREASAAAWARVPDMILSFLREDGFRRRLQMAHEKLPAAARTRGETECCRSGRCCWTGPCELSPEDPPKIAARLGMTEQGLFRDFLVVDEAREGEGLRVVPRRKEQSGGHYLTDDETYDANTPCVFLTAANECQIHAVKPTGGAFFKCWDPATHGVPKGVLWTEEQVMALGWDGSRNHGDDE